MPSKRQNPVSRVRLGVASEIEGPHGTSGPSSSTHQHRPLCHPAPRRASGSAAGGNRLAAASQVRAAVGRDGHAVPRLPTSASAHFALLVRCRPTSRTIPFRFCNRSTSHVRLAVASASASGSRPFPIRLRAVISRTCIGRRIGDRPEQSLKQRSLNGGPMSRVSPHTCSPLRALCARR